MSKNWERDPLASHNESMKAYGTFALSLGLLMLSYSVIGPAIQGDKGAEVSGGARAFWFIAGIVLVAFQQLVLNFALKREKKDV